MDTSLRHWPGPSRRPSTRPFSISAPTQGVLRAAEKCNGVGECRKSHLMGGTMCPSYMATRNEQDTTRARANMLRQVLTASRADMPIPGTAREVADVMDLCLSCKGCKSECPSNVDVARLKAEWQQHYHDANGVPLRSRLIANFATSMRLGLARPGALQLGRHRTRTCRAGSNDCPASPRSAACPRCTRTTLAAWHAKTRATPADSVRRAPYPNGRVYLFCDEFTNYTDTPTSASRPCSCSTGSATRSSFPKHVESGRAHFSKGLVREAQKFAIRNVELLQDVITADAPLIGIEPSAILGFRDEYPDLVPGAPAGRRAEALAKNALLIDEFIAREADAGRITRESFKTEPRSDQAPRPLPPEGALVAQSRP